MPSIKSIQSVIISNSHMIQEKLQPPRVWVRILVQVTIYRSLQIGRDGHLDQSEAYDIS